MNRHPYTLFSLNIQFKYNDNVVISVINHEKTQPFIKNVGK